MYPVAPAVTAPPHPVPALLRTARAAAFALVCTALSAAGHALMSPDPLPLWVLAAGFAAVLLAALAVAGRERSLLSISALLLLGQAGLHTLFTWGSALADPAAGAAGGGGGGLVDRLLCGSRDSAGHVMLPQGWSREDVLAASGIDPTLYAQPAAHHSGGGGMSGMLAAHVFAGLVAAWWLRQGEAVLFRLLARLGSTVAAGLRVALAVLALVFPVRVRPVTRPVLTFVPTLTSAWLRCAVGRRGPPFPLFVH